MLDRFSPTDTIAPAEPAQSTGLPELKLLMAAPRGFCAGVRRAIDAVVDALDRHGAPVYVRRPIVHNRAVMASLEAQGAIFVEELEEIPEGSVVVLSAHGVRPEVRAEAAERELIAYDAVCPLVAKVHREVVRHHRGGRHVILVGHGTHPEVIGTLGHVPAGAATVVNSASDVAALEIGRDAPVGYAVQTTYAVDEADIVIRAIEARFRDLAAPPASDICYATTNRQAAVRRLAPMVDAMIVAGEHFSSNACRLAEVAEAAGCPSVQLVADASRLDWRKLPPGGSVGITAAASTPEIIVRGIVDALGERYSISVEEFGANEEAISFKRLAIG
jgi:4-hydroxy-3-methylbut-2-enyl diphosphate reductase